MKRHYVCTVFLAICFVLSAWQGAFAAKKWDLILYVGVSHPSTILFKEMADEVKKRTNGSLEIVVRPAGELPFTLNEVARVVGQGQVQLGDGYSGFIAGDVKIASMPCLPFLIRTVDELQKSMAVLEPYINKELDKFGETILFWYAYPPQNVWGRGKPINTIADFKGRKIRANSPEATEMLLRFGAIPVTFTSAEVATAAQRGAIDGVITAGYAVLGSKWFEFLEWGFVPDLNIGGPSYILVNKKALDSLTPDERNTLQAVGREFRERLMQQLPGREEEYRKTLETQHKIRIIRPPASEIQKGRKIMEPYYSEWAKGGMEAEALQKVRKLLEK